MASYESCTLNPVYKTTAPAPTLNQLIETNTYQSSFDYLYS